MKTMIKNMTMVMGLMGLISVVRAADYYVDASVEATGSGTEVSPFKTIQEGVAAATADGGGKVYLAAGTYSQDDITPVSSSFINLTAAVEIVGKTGNPNDVIISTTKTGGGYRLVSINHAYAVLTAVTLNGGYVKSGGGNIFIDSNGGKVTNCIVMRGSSEQWNGGGGNIYMTGPGHINRCVIKGGGCTSTGVANGAHGIKATNGLIENCLIVSNGLASVLGSSVSALSKNNLESRAGGETCNLSGTAQMLNCTIADNHGGKSYGGVYVQGTGVTVKNCVFYRNASAEQTVDFSGSGFSYCTSDTAADTDTNVIKVTDPGLDENYTAIAGTGSPLENAGASYEGMSATDLAGNTRVVGGVVDIGCYEFQQASSLVTALTATPSAGAVPLTVSYTGTVRFATGTVTFNWDFDADGVVDATTTAAVDGEVAVSTIDHAFTTPGSYLSTVAVSDSGSGLSGTAALANPVSVSGMYYVDSTAAPGGNGSAAEPFQTLYEAVSKVGANDIIALIGGEGRVYPLSADLTITNRGIRIVGIGETKPVISVAEPDKFKIVFSSTEGGCRVENVSFDFTKGCVAEHFMTFLGPDASVVDCDFALQGGSLGYISNAGYYFIDFNASANSTVRGCSFSNLRTEKEGWLCRVVRVGTETTIVANFLTNCCTLAHGEEWKMPVSIVSNRVVDSSSHDAALFASAWNRLHHVTVFGNLVLSTAEVPTGTAIHADRNFSHGTERSYFANNTFVNQEIAIHMSCGANPASLGIVNNLFVGCATNVYDSAADKSSFSSDATRGGLVRCNLSVGSGEMLVANGRDFVLDGSPVVSDNVSVAAGTLKFMNTTDVTSPDYYRPKTDDRQSMVWSGGWTNGGTLPSYVGALEPYLKPAGLILMFR